MVKILLLLFFLILFAGLINGRIIRLAIVGVLLFFLVREIRQLKIDSFSFGCCDQKSWTGPSVLATVEKQIPIASGTIFELRSPFGGKIKIEGWKKDFVDINVKKRGANQDDLQKIAIDISSNASDGATASKVTVVGSLEGSEWLRGSWSGSAPCIDYKIKVPKKMLREMNLHVTSGDVTIESVNLDKTVSVKSSSGQIKIKDINADVKVNASSGQVAVQDIDGGVSINTSSGFVSVKDVEKMVRVSSASGAIALKKIGESASASTSSGFISMEGVKADVQANTASGSINLSDVAGAVTASASSGSITVTRAKKAQGHVKCFTRSGQIIVRDSSGKVLAQGSGKITL